MHKSKKGNKHAGNEYLNLYSNSYYTINKMTFLNFFINRYNIPTDINAVKLNGYNKLINNNQHIKNLNIHDTHSSLNNLKIEELEKLVLYTYSDISHVLYNHQNLIELSITTDRKIPLTINCCKKLKIVRLNSEIGKDFVLDLPNLEEIYLTIYNSELNENFFTRCYNLKKIVISFNVFDYKTALFIETNNLDMTALKLNFPESLEVLTIEGGDFNSIIGLENLEKLKSLKLIKSRLINITCETVENALPINTIIPSALEDIQFDFINHFE